MQNKKQYFVWSNHHKAYEVSSQGDFRFSALYAKMPDGRTLESHYQCDVKKYNPGGSNWQLGKGKPPLDTSVNLWAEYLKLWKIWAKEHPRLIEELRLNATLCDFKLKDSYARTDINQARALAHILNYGVEDDKS